MDFGNAYFAAQRGGGLLLRFIFGKETLISLF
jgi:hypothetical protein